MRLALLALFLAQDATIKVNVNLVQIDVTVTDKQGRHIAGLTADDFEVFQNGKRQTVTKVLWVGRKPPSPMASGTAPNADVSAPIPVRQLRKDQVRRTVVLYVDDLSLSMPSMYYAREAMKKFCETNLAEGDLVALFRSSSGVSFLQQFTNDRRQLLAAIERLSQRSLLGVDALAPIEATPLEDGGDPTIAALARDMRLRDETAVQQRQDIVTAGVLSSVQFLVRGLRELPGRKSIIFFSESVQLFDAPQAMFNPTMTSADTMRPGAMGGLRDRTAAALRNLIDLANRNGVVLYAIDPRGLQPLGMTAADVPSSDPRRGLAQMQQRRYQFNVSQDGMYQLAEETGGIFFQGTNDITAALASAVSDQEDYYLVGYNPDDESFEKTKSGPKFHKLEVKVKRRGVQVRFRKGFFGVSDEERFPSEGSALVSAMMSPFRSVEVPVKLTPLLVPESTNIAGRLRALVHMDASAFTYQDSPAEPEDKDQRPWKKTEVEVAIYLFDLDGRPVDHLATTHTIRLRGETYDKVMANGLLQQLDLEIKKPGYYQLRAAVLDRGSQLAGSAVQFIQVPDLKRKRLALTDLIISGADWSTGASGVSGPAMRRIAPGEPLEYNMLVFNANRDGAGRPNLEMQICLYRDGKQVFRGPREPLALSDTEAGASLSIKGSMRLGLAALPGEYVIELAVRDLLAPKKEQFAVKLSDFQILPAGQPQ